MSIEELKKDVAEIRKFEEQSERSRIKEILQITKHKIEMEIVNLELELKHKAETASVDVPHHPEPKRYSVELNEYAFDQSDKFVKLFVTLKDSQQLQESDVQAHFTLHSLTLTVNNLSNKDYRLVIKNLLHEINREKSYFKIKTDMIAVYLKKQKEGQTWEHLTSIEKKLKDAKESNLKSKDIDSSDPTAGIMNLMKKMYEEGDASTKQMIAKTWTESMNKQQNGPDF